VWCIIFPIGALSESLLPSLLTSCEPEGVSGRDDGVRGLPELEVDLDLDDLEDIF